MPGRLKRATRPASAIACVVALTLSFVVARAGGEPQADEAAIPAITPTKHVAATTSEGLGLARGLPALAPEPPKPRKPRKRKPAPPEPPAASPAAPAPAPAPAPAEPEPAYTPPPTPVVPAQPAPEPVSPPAPPPQPDPSPPVYFDDSG